jgi:membrane protein DedA with SNARE-associated domain
VSAEIVTGSIALAGVVVGGTLNGSISYWLQRRLERRAARTACRLLLEEMRRSIQVSTAF